MQKKITSVVIGIGLILLSSGCGNRAALKDEVVSKKTDAAKERLEGKYTAKMKPLNSSVSGMSTGEVSILVQGDEFLVQMEMRDVPALTMHAQYIYSGTECPKASDDRNDDGFIDPVEASARIGKILIPLDQDLNSQQAGMDVFPVADRHGYYEYFQTGSLSALIQDLTAPEMNSEGELSKLTPDHSLKLDGKVIVVMGVSEDVYLPGSIRSIGQNSERATLSISCGIIERVFDEEVEGSN